MKKITAKRIAAAAVVVGVLILFGASRSSTAQVLPVTRSYSLHTSTLYIGFALYSCNVSNVSAAPVTVQATILDVSGAVVASEGMRLEPGHSGSVLGGNVASVRCRVTLQGTPDAIRAALTVLSGETGEAVAVSEAR